MFGNLERAWVREGNVHTAHDWHSGLERAVARSSDEKIPPILPLASTQHAHEFSLDTSGAHCYIPYKSGREPIRPRRPARNATSRIGSTGPLRRIRAAEIRISFSGGWALIDPEPDRDLLRGEILEVVENQLRDNEPPETRATLTRLMTEGRSESEAKKLIGCVVVAEMFEVLRQNQDYDQDRYVAALAALPQIPE